MAHEEQKTYDDLLNDVKQRNKRRRMLDDAKDDFIHNRKLPLLGIMPHFYIPSYPYPLGVFGHFGCKEILGEIDRTKTQCDTAFDSFASAKAYNESLYNNIRLEVEKAKIEDKRRQRILNEGVMLLLLPIYAIIIGILVWVSTKY